MNEIQNQFLNKVIFGKYKIIKEEGKGVNSMVFSAKNLKNQESVALKIQGKTHFLGDLEKEAYYLFQLKGIGIPKLISYGHYGKYKILVEELLGKSIEQLFKENINRSKIIRLKDMLMAGIQIIDRIQFIHSNNILHLDIKPNNFLVGKNDNSLIYIIDFGFARKYRSSRTGRHVKFSKNTYFSGNLKYSSANTMKGIIPSRRDDLESLGYMLIYLYKQKLPWDNLICKNKYEFSQKIFEIKKLLPIKMLCEDLPKEIIQFMKYVKTLKFEEEPKYEYLTKILETILEKINIVNDMNFSWINQSITSCFTKIPNKIFYKVVKKKKSPFSRIINLGPIFKDNILNNPKNNNYKNNDIKEEEKYLHKEETKDIRQNKKTSFSTKCSEDKKLKFYKIKTKDNMEKKLIDSNKNKILKINISERNFLNEKIINSRNVFNYNNTLKKPINYKSTTNNNNNINYNLIVTQFISNKPVNNLNYYSKNININLNRLNLTLNNSNKYFIMKNSFNKIGSKKVLFNNYNTNNYISPLKYNDLLNKNDEEKNDKLTNDIIYYRKFEK